MLSRAPCSPICTPQFTSVASNLLEEKLRPFPWSLHCRDGGKERGCEHTWRKFHGHCYRYFSRRHTWEDAEKDCREHSGHLASIHSLFTVLMPQIRLYNYLSVSVFLLYLMLQQYENWRENQPDNFFAGGEDCVVMIAHENGKWNDVPCNYNLRERERL
uniref:Neurocan n=1 Tax=Myripristis murdjan TaxID=586833 RepID=A0A667YWL9_9TELE